MRPEQIIVALDGMDRDKALLTAWALSTKVWGFKVNDLLLSYGLDIIRDLKGLGRVFADPKLYDIPKTISHSVSRLADAGADLITVHASAGRDGLQAAVESAGDSKILAVTVLTSMDEPTVQDVYCRSVDEAVWDLAHLAYDAGAHGIVCSSQEVGLLKHLSLLKVVPGIRLASVDGDDQRRTGGGAGADLYVIGRPITQASDPVEALNALLRGNNDAASH